MNNIKLLFEESVNVKNKILETGAFNILAKMEEYEMLKDEISLLKKDTEKLKFEPK